MIAYALYSEQSRALDTILKIAQLESRQPMDARYNSERRRLTSGMTP
jgi:hypothetical protein